MPSFSCSVGGVDRPLIRPSVRTGAPSPRGEGFGRGKPSYRVSNPLPSNGLARQGSRSGRQPEKKTQRPPPTFPSNGLARQGTPRRVSPPAGGERKSNHVLTGSAGQNILLTPRVPGPARRGSGCNSQFWEGPKTRQAACLPRTLSSRTKHKRRCPSQNSLTGTARF